MALTTSYTAFATELLAALEQFDCKIAPQGLYAAEEHRVKEPLQRWEAEWKLCLMPVLKAAGTTFANKGRLERYPSPFDHNSSAVKASFIVPKLGQIQLTMIRLSKIRVKLYGNGYRIDPHLDLSHRWSKLPFVTFLKDSRQDRPIRFKVHSMLLLLGFDVKQDPFGNEFSDLRKKRNWEHLGWNLHTRSWADPQQRGFFTRAAIWVPQDALSIPPASS